MKEYRFEIDGKKYRVRIRETYGDRAVVQVNDDIYQVDITQARVPEPSCGPVLASPSSQRTPQPPAGAPRTAPVAGRIVAPMPGVILSVKVGVGDMVYAGDVVMVIEAMKMENDIKAATSGTVKKVLVGAGESVNTGQALIEIG